MAHYLLTGAAGFIGSRVTQMLLDAGHQVTGVDNLNNAYDVRLKHYRLKRLQAEPNFHFYQLDISDRAILQIEQLASNRKQIPPFTAIINLAARAGVRQSVENPWVYLDTNMTGTLNLLELSRQSSIPKFILASTSSIYGSNAPLPTPETADSSHPLQVYAASKKSAEALCHVYHYLYGIDVTIFRYFTVYGPAGRPDMSMFRFVKWISEGEPLQLNGDGEQSRGFTYVDDIAHGTILGLKNLGYEIINLGGHETITMNRLIQMLEERIGKSARVMHFPNNPADMLANHADVSKAHRLLGWQPQTNLERGVSNLVAWYQAERDWASQINTD
jgi:nucleoside-diphosphate-sugar epimerase